MKRLLIPTALLMLAMSLSLSAFAKGKSTEVQIYQTSQISGTTLQPGIYKVMLNTTGSAADLIFLQNGKQVATVTGQVVQLTKKPQSTSVTVDNSGSTPRIAEIDLEGLQTGVSFAPVVNSASGE